LHFGLIKRRFKVVIAVLIPFPRTALAKGEIARFYVAFSGARGQANFFQTSADRFVSFRAAVVSRALLITQ